MFIGLSFEEKTLVALSIGKSVVSPAMVLIDGLNTLFGFMLQMKMESPLPKNMSLRSMYDRIP